MSQLAARHCEVCTADTPLLSREEVAQLLPDLGSAWTVADGRRLHRALRFADFAGAFALTTRIAAVAEEEGHHPELTVGWGHLDVDITTHAAGGLTTNDFILAAKVDALAQ